MRRLLLLTLSGFLLAVDIGRAAALAKANHLLETGRWRLAISAYEAIVETHPTSARARLGLALALRRGSQCDRALVLLTGLRHRRVWSAEAALAEGDCYLRIGDRSSAFVAFEEAFLMDITPVTALNVAYARAEEGRLKAFAEAQEALVMLDDDGRLETLLLADLALRQGEPEVDAYVVEAERQSRGELPPGLAVVDARRWLDLDHPAEASQVLLASLRRQMSHLQSAIWRAEALRRAGQLADADSALSRPMVQQANSVPLGRSVRARMAIDAGNLALAESLARDLPLDEEGMATRWYVARAVGDKGAQATWARRWAAVSVAQDRSLEQLVPLHVRETL
jgi:tetratricopeptide (TPR) repeat protein